MCFFLYIFFNLNSKTVSFFKAFLCFCVGCEILFFHICFLLISKLPHFLSYKGNKETLHESKGESFIKWYITKNVLFLANFSGSRHNFRFLSKMTNLIKIVYMFKYLNVYMTIPTSLQCQGLFQTFLLNQISRSTYNLHLYNQQIKDLQKDYYFP